MKQPRSRYVQLGAILSYTAFLAGRKINNLPVFNEPEYSDSPRLHHFWTVSSKPVVNESGRGMPNLNISIPHKLSQDEALRRIKDAIARAKAQHSGKIKDLQENWNGSVGTFSGSAMGHAASGTITVNPSGIVLDLALPFAATFFKGKIEADIRAWTAGLLS